MNGKEVEIIVKSCENSSDFVSSKVTTSWCQLMWTSLHHLSEDTSLQSQTNSRHLCDSITSVNHMLAPSLESGSECREILRQLILGDILHHISNIIEVSPFCVKRRRRRGGGFVSILIVYSHFFLISSLLSKFRCGSYLEIVLRKDIRYGSIGVELNSPFMEELLHKIKEFIVMLDVDSWILDDKEAIFLKGLSYFLTILGIVA